MLMIIMYQSVHPSDFRSVLLTKCLLTVIILLIVWQILMSTVWFMLCLTGYLWQTIDISVYYFMYDTTTDISIQVPDRIKIHDFSLCIRYFDVFDHKRYHQDTQFNFSDAAWSSFAQRVKELEAAITIKDVFEYTPRIDGNMWFQCLTRKILDYNIIMSNGTECLQIFSVKKYIVQEFVCYRFHQIVSENQTYDYRNIAYSLTYSGVFYGIILNKPLFDRANYCRALVHDTKSLPEKSLAFASPFSRKKKEDDEDSKYNLFHLSYSRLEMDRLEPPYRTYCLHYSKYGFESRKTCRDECLVRQTRGHYDKYPFSVIISEPLEEKVISSYEIENRTFSLELQRLENECHANCSQKDCHDEYTLTSLLKEDNYMDQGMSFMINAPRTPSYYVRHRALQETTDFIVYVLSTFGTWFGISVLSLNPSFLIKWRSGINEKKNPRVDSPSKLDVRRKSHSRDTRRNTCMIPSAECTCCLITRSSLRKEFMMELQVMKQLMAAQKFDSTYKIVMDRIPVRRITPPEYHRRQSSGITQSRPGYI